MAGIRIVTDSSCDLPEALATELGISIVPLTIRFGDEEFVDRVELPTDEFWRRCQKSATLPETAAPAPGAFSEVFGRLADEGADGIVVINLARSLSATIASAEVAAKEVADRIPVRVVDSGMITMGLGMVCVAAARAGAQPGATVDGVADLAKSLSTRTVVYAALGGIENLKKGGRIGGAQAFLGTLLNIKPVIKLEGGEGKGEVEAAAKQRTRAKSLAYLVDRVKEAGTVEHLAVMHAVCDDVDTLLGLLRPIYSGEIFVADIGPVIGTHGGLGTIGVVIQT